MLSRRSTWRPGPSSSLDEVSETTYPEAAVTWLVGTDQKSVLEIGAADGALTAQLVAAGHDVHATDSSSEAVDRLAERFPGIRTSAATAERLPNLDASVDVVVCRNFSTYDEAAALAEFARVLRPGGQVAVVVEALDVKIPWVRKFARLIGNESLVPETPASIVHSTSFGFVDADVFRHWSTVDRDALCAVALRDPGVATLDPAAQERLLDDVRALYDDYGRGPDGMQLPQIAHCFRAGVIEHPWSVPPRAGATPADDPDGTDDASAPASEVPGDDDGLLIDFR